MPDVIGSFGLLMLLLHDLIEITCRDSMDRRVCKVEPSLILFGLQGQPDTLVIGCCRISVVGIGVNDLMSAWDEVQYEADAPES
jgi:hypothetical protein